MRRERVPFILFAAGLALVILAIFWSLYAYGEVGPDGRLQGPAASQQFPLPHVFWRHVRSAARLHMRRRAHTAYSPLVFGPVLSR